MQLASCKEKSRRNTNNDNNGVGKKKKEKKEPGHRGQTISQQIRVIGVTSRSNYPECKHCTAFFLIPTSTSSDAAISLSLTGVTFEVYDPADVIVIDAK